jgi:hypothetical protein
VFCLTQVLRSGPSTAETTHGFAVADIVPQRCQGAGGDDDHDEEEEEGEEGRGAERACSPDDATAGRACAADDATGDDATPADVSTADVTADATADDVSTADVTADDATASDAITDDAPGRRRSGQASRWSARSVCCGDSPPDFCYFPTYVAARMDGYYPTVEFFAGGKGGSDLRPIEAPQPEVMVPDRPLREFVVQA